MLAERRPTSKPFQLKRLKPIHRQAIHLHLQGMKLKEIAEEIGMSLWQVSRVLNTDLAQEAIAEHHERVSVEFKSQYLSTIDALREGLRSPDIRTQLRAADKVLKAHAHEFARARVRGKTAEDVIQQIMDLPLENLSP